MTSYLARLWNQVPLLDRLTGPLEKVSWAITLLQRGFAALSSLAHAVFARVSSFFGFAYANKFRWAAFLALIGFLITATFVVSCFSYVVVNQLLIPRMYREWDLVFAPSTSSVRLANVTIGDLSSNTRYSFDLHLHVPESRQNLKGEKTVGMILENVGGRVLWAQRRSVLLRYKSWLRLVGERLVWMLMFVWGLAEEAQHCVTQLAHEWLNEEGAIVARVELDSQLQIYTAKLIARATLKGLAYYWYHWRLTTMCIFVAVMWGMQLATLCVVALLFFCCGQGERSAGAALPDRGSVGDAGYVGVVLDPMDSRALDESDEVSDDSDPPPLETSNANNASLTEQPVKLRRRHKKKKHAENE